MKLVLLSAFAALAFSGAGPAAAQADHAEGTQTIRLVSGDVDRFWTAYDAVRTTPDPDEQRRLFQTLYLDPGTPGLAAFMAAKGYTIDNWIDAIRRYPRYWETVRPRTALAAEALGRTEAHLERLRALYPGLRPAGVYFEVGALRSAGTTHDDKVIIGVEMATGDDSVDISEMPSGLQRFFQTYFASRPLDNLDLLITHEVVHTQQVGERRTLLAQALYEGVADFVAEKATGRLPDLPYVAFGPAHDAAIKSAFRQDMAGEDFSGWLYNGPSGAFGVGDLGYYVGYAIVSRYYHLSSDKDEAIRTLIELDYGDQTAIDTLVAASGYFDDEREFATRSDRRARTVFERHL